MPYETLRDFLQRRRREIISLSPDSRSAEDYDNGRIAMIEEIQQHLDKANEEAFGK